MCVARSSGMSRDSDLDLQSWGWTDLCVSSSSVVSCQYVGQAGSVSDKVTGLCCNQTDDLLLLFVDTDQYISL